MSIDGTDIRRYRLKSLRDQISFVLQDTLLFRATVWENIAYGKPNATPGEIRRAAELADAHAFIEEMPDGYDTWSANEACRSRAVNASASPLPGRSSAIRRS